jgi:hypothetical protein
MRTAVFEPRFLAVCVENAVRGTRVGNGAVLILTHWSVVVQLAKLAPCISGSPEWSYAERWGEHRPDSIEGGGRHDALAWAGPAHRHGVRRGSRGLDHYGTRPIGRSNDGDDSAFTFAVIGELVMRMRRSPTSRWWLTKSMVISQSSSLTTWMISRAGPGSD